MVLVIMMELDLEIEAMRNWTYGKRGDTRLKSADE
jgi:hypothetical protein